MKLRNIEDEEMFEICRSLRLRCKIHLVLVSLPFRQVLCHRSDTGINLRLTSVSSFSSMYLVLKKKVS